MYERRMARRRLSTFAALLLAPALCLAQASPKEEAAQRFRRGLERFNDGDNARALTELKRAQELAPHPAVLFNIGIVYAAMGRPVDAEAAFTESLKIGLAGDLAERAKRLLAEQTALIGELSVTAAAPGVLEIDGVEAAKLPLAKPLRIASGTHVVGVVAEGHAPSRREVLVTAGVKTDVAFELVPMATRVAHLKVTGQLAAVEVVVDGAVVARTPLATSVALVPGTRKVELRRAGYAARRADLAVVEGATAELAADLDEDPSGARGFLVLNVSEKDAAIAVDGKPRGGATNRLSLPPGEHSLRIERTGFLPTSRTVTVAADGERVLTITLEATAETRAKHEAAYDGTSKVGWAFAIAGGVLMAGGGYFYLTGKGKRDDATKLLTAYDADTQTGGPCDPKGGFKGSSEAECSARLDDIDKKDKSGKTMSTAGLVTGGVGVVALGTGVVVLLSRGDRNKYEPKATESPYAFTLVPGRTPSLVLSGRF